MLLSLPIKFCRSLIAAGCVVKRALGREAQRHRGTKADRYFVPLLLCAFSGGKPLGLFYELEASSPAAKPSPDVACRCPASAS
jgi:hypothetical protein